MKAKRLTGGRLMEFFAKIEDNCLEENELGKYNIRGYEVTVKKRTQKYIQKKLK